MLNLIHNQRTKTLFILEKTRRNLFSVFLSFWTPSFHHITKKGCCLLYLIAAWDNDIIVSGSCRVFKSLTKLFEKVFQRHFTSEAWCDHWQRKDRQFNTKVAAEVDKTKQIREEEPTWQVSIPFCEGWKNTEWHF